MVEQRRAIDEAVDQHSQRSIESAWDQSHTQRAKKHDAGNEDIAQDLKVGIWANFVSGEVGLVGLYGFHEAPLHAKMTQL
jgi:hypothetical protein